MITPLGQRQVFQTAHMEAVRQAHDVVEQVQREAARKQVADDHLLEELEGVHTIPHSEGIRTEERQGRGRQPGQEKEAPEEEPQASPAESHLDLLA